LQDQPAVTAHGQELAMAVRRTTSLSMAAISVTTAARCA
jgi:hypothetical protein